MPHPVSALLRAWEDRAAVRAEHELEPTLRRRFDRLPSTIASRRALRAERRLRRPDVRQVDESISRAWTGFKDPWR